MEKDGKLDPDVTAWIQRLADEHHGGNWGAAAAGILEDVYAATLAPDDPWAHLDARMRRTAKPGHRPAERGECGQPGRTEAMGH